MLQRLNIIIIFSAILLPNLSFASNEYSSINYTIHFLCKTSVPIIKIEAEIKGKLSNQLIINLPYKWANARYINQIQNVKVWESNYKSTINRKDDHQLIITIPKQTNSIKISYEIHQKAENTSNVHETIIRMDLIHSTGYGLFATPDDIKDTDKIPFNIEWKEIPNEWSTISSYGILAS